MLLLFKCTVHSHDESNNYVILSGNIKNSSKDSLKVLIDYKNELKTIPITNGNFRDSFSVDTGYYILAIGNEITEVFLINGFDIHINIDEKEFDESIIYSGNEGVDINNYIAQKTLNDEKIGAKNPYLFQLSENKFLDSLETIVQNQYIFLQRHSELPHYFVFLDSSSIALDKHGSLRTYEPYKKTFFDPSFELSDTFPNPYENLDINNVKLLKINNYLSLLIDYFENQIETNSDDLTKKNDTIIKLITEQITSSKVKDHLLYYLASKLNSPEEYIATYNSVVHNIADDKLKEKLELIYNSKIKLASGSPSPLFELKDTTGNSVSLTDLKGSLVYIDIWATWCKPCLNQIPYFKEIEEEYRDKNIQFVSICSSSKIENWKNLVREHNLKGIQLYASESEEDFIKAYNITGVPRYILLDEELNIINSDAPRPSNKKLRTLLDENL